MKRLLLLFLALNVTLTSCAVVSVSKKQEIKPVNPDNVFVISGELPNIGEFSGKTQHKRFYEEYTPYFIPSDEYGSIIPYVANAKVYRSNMDGEDSFGMRYQSCGFCTPDGRIVMDASSDYSYIGYGKTPDGFEYYDISLVEQNEDTPLDDVYMPDKTLIIPKSGAWCLELTAGSWVCSAGNGIIAISMCPEVTNPEHYPTPDRIELYDYDGNLVFTFEGADGAGVYSNGMINISYYDSYYENGNYIYNDSAYFYNLEGEVVLGPYKFADAFNKQGYTYVTDMNDEVYIINTQGERITTDNIQGMSPTGVYEKGYGYGYEFFTASLKDSPYTKILYTGEGEKIATIRETSYMSFSFPYNGEILYNYHDYTISENSDYKSSFVWKYAKDSSPFLSKEYNVMPNEYTNMTNMFVHTFEDESAVLFDADGETVAFLEDCTYINDATNDNRFVVYQSGEVDYQFDEVKQESIVTDTSAVNIYDTEKGEIVYTVDTNGFGSIVGDDERFVLINMTDPYDMFGGLSTYYVYDLKEGKPVFENCEYISHQSIGEKDYFNVCDGNICTLYDENLNVVVKTINE